MTGRVEVTLWKQDPKSPAADGEPLLVAEWVAVPRIGDAIGTGSLGTFRVWDVWWGIDAEGHQIATVRIWP